MLTPSVFDITAYVLSQISGKKISPAKMQLLLYYCQGWWLMSDYSPMFHEDIYAFETGPKIKQMQKEYDGASLIERVSKGKEAFVSPYKKLVINEVVATYEPIPEEKLRPYTMDQLPFRKCAEIIARNVSAHPIISLDDIFTHFYTTEKNSTADLQKRFDEIQNSLKKSKRPVGRPALVRRR